MSKEKTVIKNRVTQPLVLELDREDGSAVRIWTLCPDYGAIAKIEKAINKDIKKYEDWASLSSGLHFPSVVWGLLNRHNPEVTLEEVINILNPEAQRSISDWLFDELYPGAREAIEKALKEQGASEAPNVQTGTLSNSNPPQIIG